MSRCETVKLDFAFLQWWKNKYLKTEDRKHPFDAQQQITGHWTAHLNTNIMWKTEPDKFLDQVENVAKELSIMQRLHYPLVSAGY